jgi:hypothetical protein
MPIGILIQYSIGVAPTIRPERASVYHTESAGSELSCDEAVTQAETGGSTDAALPATPHQEEALAGDQQGESKEAGAATSAGQADVPASPHQQQALAAAQGDDQQPAAIMAEARDLAEAGDEEGCMEKVTQVKDLLGLD